MSYKESKFNSSGFRPVADMAIGWMTRGEQKSKNKTKSERVYICSPFRGDVQKNTENVIRYCRFAVECNKFPIAPHAYLPRFMDDNNPAERELALSFGIRLLQDCSELWLFAENLSGKLHISEGMQMEIEAAKKYKIPIKKFNQNLEEM